MRITCPSGPPTTRYSSPSGPWRTSRRRRGLAREEPLFADDLVAVERQAHQGLPAQRTDEEAALPAGVAITRQEGHAAGRDGGRNPVLQWLLEAGLRPFLADARADAVVAAVGQQRPAVVEPGTHAIDLVAALRAMLHGPQLARGGVQRRALHVAVTQAPQLGRRTGAANEGVVGRHAAVGLDADDLAQMVGGRLRVVLAREAVAQAHEQTAIPREHEARAAVQAAAHLGQLPEDDLHVGHALAIEPAARHGHAVATLAGFGIGPVDQAVVGELRVHGHVEQAALAARVDGGQAGEWFTRLAIRRQHAQPALSFGDEHAAVRQEGQRPRFDEAARQGFEAGLRQGGPCQQGPKQEDQCLHRPRWCLHCLAPTVRSAFHTHARSRRAWNAGAPVPASGDVRDGPRRFASGSLRMFVAPPPAHPFATSMAGNRSEHHNLSLSGRRCAGRAPCGAPSSTASRGARAARFVI